jgi:DNA (cytosine-5)-methyltransferase 1
VDVVAAGLPCQPYSQAGKRRGHADERALWPEFVRIVEECEPVVCFIENVPPFLKHFEPVHDELRRMGFELAPPLRASAASEGGPHLRRRVFIAAAHPDRAGLEGLGVRGRRRADEGAAGEDHRADPDSGRGGCESRCIEGGESASKKDGKESRGYHRADPDPDRGRRERERCGWVFDAVRQTFRNDLDGPGDRCCAVGAPWAVESPVVRVADGPPYRVDRLRAIGNAVVPCVATSAWCILVEGELGVTF